MLCDEEASYLTKLLTQSPTSDPMAENIRTKLGLIGKTVSAAEWVHHGKISRIIQILSLSMTEKRQVLLKSYHSASSGTINNRLVEPAWYSPITNRPFRPMSRQLKRINTSIWSVWRISNFSTHPSYTNPLMNSALPMYSDLPSPNQLKKST